MRRNESVVISAPQRVVWDYLADLDEVYDHITRVMQETLDGLAAERRFPVIG